MKRFAYGLGLALLVLAPATLAATPEDICEIRYPIPVREINSVEEKTGHDPLLFLFRRCITKERKAQEAAARRGRQLSRIVEKGDRTKAYGEDLLRTSEADLKSAIQKQLKKDAKLQSRLKNTEYIKARRDARAARQKMIGTSRLNEIKRKLREAKPDDPCSTVRVISKIRPCKEDTDSGGAAE